MSGRQGAGIRADVAAALAENGVASLARSGAPILVCEGVPPRVIHANAAALSLFGAAALDDLQQDIFPPGSPAIQALASQTGDLPAGANRVERFDFGDDFGRITLLCRRIDDAASLTIFAGLGLRLREQRAAPTASTAPPPAKNSESFRALKRNFERRYPNLKPARFLWRTDARNVVTEMTPPLAEIFGGAAATLAGRDLLEAARALGVDPDRRLAAALNGRSTFSGVEVLWPIAGQAAAAPVSFGALPAFDREKGFDGWRGFGVIHLDRLQERAQDPTPVTAADPQARGADASGIVLPFPPARGAPEGARDEPASQLVTLSANERHAFREIARTLGAQAPDQAVPSESEAPVEPIEARPPDTTADHAVLDSLPTGVAIRRDGLWLHANRTLLNWLGCADQAEFQGHGGLNGFGRDPASATEITLQPRNGRAFAAEIEAAPATWQGMAAEILLLRRSTDAGLKAKVSALETSLRQRETEAADIMAVLQTASDGVALINAEGALLGLNPAAESLFGRSRHDPTHFSELIAPEDQQRAREAIASLAAGAAVPDCRLTGLTGAGESRVLKVHFVRLSDAGKFACIFRAESAASETEQALRAAKERAESESRAKTDYLTAVTHEIRTPLNAILGFTEVIMDERFGPVGNARYKEYLRDIHASGAHVMSLVNDLLDLSKIEAGKFDLKFTAVDVNQVIAECVSLMQPQASRERVITRLALATRLPPALADERSLRQIALNLLTNAIRYNEPGGQVIVSTTVDKGMVLLRVKVTGIGMNEAELRLALEPFRQASSRTDGGTGLGLPLTKALAEANRAEFAIRSRKNEGTLVEVAFPLAPGAQETQPTQIPARSMEQASR